MHLDTAQARGYTLDVFDVSTDEDEEEEEEGQGDGDTARRYVG